MSDGTNEAKGLFGLFADWRELVIAWALAVLGGLARYAKTLSQNHPEKIIYVQAGAKLFLAGFAGLCFYLLSADWNVGPHWKALAIAISGHMGAEAIEFIESGVRDALRRYANAGTGTEKEEDDSR